MGGLDRFSTSASRTQAEQAHLKASNVDPSPVLEAMLPCTREFKGIIDHARPKQGSGRHRQETIHRDGHATRRVSVRATTPGWRYIIAAANK